MEGSNDVEHSGLLGKFWSVLGYSNIELLEHPSFSLEIEDFFHYLKESKLFTHDSNITNYLNYKEHISTSPSVFDNINYFFGFLFQHGNNNEVLNYISSHKELVNIRDQNGSTMLHIATQASHLKMLKILLENGADIDAKDNNEKTAFYYSSLEEEKMPISCLLISMGADIGFSNIKINLNNDVVSFLRELVILPKIPFELIVGVIVIDSFFYLSEEEMMHRFSCSQNNSKLEGNGVDSNEDTKKIIMERVLNKAINIYHIKNSFSNVEKYLFASAFNYLTTRTKVAHYYKDKIPNEILNTIGKSNSKLF